MIKPLAVLAAVLFAASGVLLAGCTELERTGYSAIPQNAPATWEMEPYGSLRN